MQLVSSIMIASRGTGTTCKIRGRCSL